MGNKFKSFLNSYKLFFIYFFVIFFSFFFFRGRLGSDDLEVFNLVLAIKNSQLNFIDFIYYLKDNHSAIVLNSEIFLDSSQLPYFKTWNHRFFWVLQTYLINTLVNFLPFKIQIVNFLSMYFAGFILSFYTCLSFCLCYFIFRKQITDFESLFLSIMIFFGTGLIAFFSGSFIESSIILLIVLRFFLKKNQAIFFFIDFLILIIKPYYFIILIAFYFKGPSKTNFFSKLFIPSILFICIYGLRQLPIFKVPLTHHLKYDYKYFTEPYKILNNLLEQYFSLGVGIFTTSLIIIILIFFGFKKDNTFYKITCFFLFTFFLSFFDQWHGQAPGGRYIIPAFFIFLEEFLAGFKIIKKKYRFIFIYLFILTILNLPTIEYRNFSLPHYKANSAILGKPATVEVENGFPAKGTLFDYPVKSFFFNHVIFSNKVLFTKIQGNPGVNIANTTIFIESIYPMTAPARIIYILESKNNVFAEKIPDFIVKYKKVIYLLYYVSITLFLLIFFISFIKSFKF